MRTPTRANLPHVELTSALVVAWALVIARSFVYAAYPHSAFDSDQAVVGLMAKHLSEGRAFPLYLYGYSYMLAVEAWAAVPYFWIAGPTVEALRASIIGTNLAVVTILIVGFQRWGGLRPLAGLAAATFFAFAPADTTVRLIDAGGGNIEPFLWILILFALRHRPFLFGSILAIGFLNREFTVYAVPVLLFGQVWTGAIVKRETWLGWLFVLVAFCTVWQGVQALTPWADLMGPGTRGALATSLAEPLGNLLGRMRVDVAQAPAGLWTLLRGEVRTLVGGPRPDGLPTDQGTDWMGVVLAVAAVLAIGRLVWLARRGQRPLADAAMGWYVFGVGLMAVAGYALTRPTDVVTGRYLLLSLFIPVGLTAVWLSLEPRRLVRQAIVGFVLAWAVVAGRGHWRVYDRYASGLEADPLPQLIAALDARSITVAEADHWRAYKLTFLTKERIIVASMNVVRISEYRRIADAFGPGLVRLQSQPCPGGGDPVAGLYICAGGTGR